MYDPDLDWTDIDYDRYENIGSAQEAIEVIAKDLCALRQTRHVFRDSAGPVKALQALADKWGVPFSYDLCVYLMDEMYEHAEWDSSSEYCGF
jgi:hypothetical protein